MEFLLTNGFICMNSAGRVGLAYEKNIGRVRVLGREGFLLRRTGLSVVK